VFFKFPVTSFDYVHLFFSCVIPEVKKKQVKPNPFLEHKLVLLFLSVTQYEKRITSFYH